MAFTKDDIRQTTLNHYIGLPFPDLLAKKIAVASEVNLNDIGKSETANHYGTAYFMDLVVTLPDGDSFRLPNEPLVKFGFRKRIVQTHVTGGKRKGTVKEFINQGDWDVQIVGVCIDPENPNEYPTDQVELIKKLGEVDEAVEVENSLLNFFGIYKLVVTTAGYDDMKGVPGAQAYKINALSDEDFYAELDQRNLNGL